MSKGNNGHTSTIKQVKGVPGLMTCTLEHEVKSSKATFDWDGPVIPREVWHPVLAFFKWTYDESKSESQVRLYVNSQTQQWRAWAFPQEANTGMNARELDTPETATQRAQFSDAEGWLYFGTVHHHCSASAFQSGVDEANERNQDGLHITVGHMDKLQYDIDARLYIGGYKLLALDLADFWSVGGIIAALPQSIKDLLPNDSLPKLAKKQMGEPPPADTEFPEQWKTNLIYKKIEIVVPRVMQQPSFPHHTGQFSNNGFKKSYLERAKPKQPYDLNRALDEIENWIKNKNEELKADPTQAHVPEWDLENVVQLVYDCVAKMHDEELEVLDILMRNDILPEDWMAFTEDKIEDRAKKELEDEIRKGNGGKLPPPDGETEKEKIMREYYGHGY